MLLVVKSKEINCRWCHKYTQLQYAQVNPEGSLPSFLEGQIYSPGKTSSTPCADLQCSPRLGQPQDTAQATTWKDLQFAGVASHHSSHSKSNMPNWLQGSISKAALPALPRVRSWTSMFLETEGCQILWLLQYKQAASSATRTKDAQFLTDLSLAFCLLLPPIALTEVTLALLLCSPPSWRQHLPQLIQHCHIWVSTSAAKPQ